MDVFGPTTPAAKARVIASHLREIEAFGRDYQAKDTISFLSDDDKEILLAMAEVIYSHSERDRLDAEAKMTEEESAGTTEAALSLLQPETSQPENETGSSVEPEPVTTEEPSES